MMESTLLGQLLQGKDCPNMEWYKTWFGDEIVSMEVWGNVLGKERVTIRRWKTEIINAVPPLSYLFNKGRKGKRGLDAYQRFIVLVIARLKAPNSQRLKGLTNQEIIDFFKAAKDDKPTWKILDRENVNYFLKELNNVK